MLNKKVIVISAINIFEGGPLSVYKDCLDFIDNSVFLDDYLVYAFVHKSKLFEDRQYSNIKFVEFPFSRKSYLIRFFYEYIYFKILARRLDVFFWLSLHDITPNIGKIKQAVYCHNPSPFNQIKFKDIYLQPKQFFFRLFYKYLYQINIHKNEFVIVQQLWIKNKFLKFYNLDGNKIIISQPKIPDLQISFSNNLNTSNNQKIFFFPTLPRPFKNIEVICDAVKILQKKTSCFKVIFTIDGTENSYSKFIFNKYQKLENIEFLGIIKREKVYEYYQTVDFLIFPSLLETWGLPISEFKQFNKPMIVANLPYAIETVGEYELVNFFDPYDSNKLANLMFDFLNNNIKYDKTNSIVYEKPNFSNWEDLFKYILN